MYLGKWLSALAAEKSTDKTNNFLYIRLLASTMVVAGHSLGLSKEYTKEAMSYFTVLGVPIHGLGVFVFFVLSGYLITSSIYNSKSIFQFALSRAFRIFPALIVCVLITAFLLGPVVTSLSSSDYFLHADTWRYITINGTLVSAVFSLPGIDYGINGSLWTIPIEGRLYIIIGILGLLTITRNRIAFIASLTAILYLISENLSAQIPASKDNINIVTCFFIGSIFYVLRTKVLMSAYIAVALSLLSFMLEGSVAGKPVLFTTVAYIVLLAGYSRKLPIPKTISDYSYGIYLYAFPIQATLIHYIPDISAISVAIISIPAAWIAGAASWYAIEKPANLLKNKYLRKNSISYA